jgi:hypothetical protein
MLLMLAFTIPGRKLSGKITDENGQPLRGALVTIKGSKTTVSTDSLGNYVLKVPEGQISLLVSYVGYEQKEVKLNQQMVMNISLQPATQTLNDVVVLPDRCLPVTLLNIQFRVG